MTDPSSVSPTRHAQDRNVESVRSILEKREQYGLKTTVLKALQSTNEQGIQLAGDQSLPFYGTLVLVGVIAAQFVGGLAPILGGPLASLGELGFFALSFVTPIIIYWDCRAADRYLDENWVGGKTLVVLSIFVTAFILPFYLYYRIRKMP